MSRPTVQVTPTAPSKGRKWRRRLLWLVALAVIARIALSLAAAPALNLVAGFFELQSDVESIEFDVLTGEARLFGLRAWHEDQDQSSPLLELEFASVDLSISSLFTADLVVRRVELDGLDLYLARDEFARWNVAPVIAPFLAERAESASDELVERQEKRSGPVEFDLPFTVEALRMTHQRVHLKDELAEPPLDTTVTATVRLTDAGDPDQRTHLSIVAAGPTVLDVFELDAGADVSGASVDSMVRLRLRGLRPQPLAGYFELLGLDPTAERIDADAQIDFDASETEAGGNHFELSITDAQWSADSTEALALEELSASAGMEAGPTLHVGPIGISGVRAGFLRTDEGLFGAAGIAYIGFDESPAATEPKAPEPAAEDSAPDEEPTDGAQERLLDLMPFGLRMDGVSIARCALRFTDHLQPDLHELLVELDEFQLGPIDSRTPEDQTSFEARAALPGLLGQLRMDGRFALFADSPLLSVALDSRGGDLSKAEPYLNRMGLQEDWTDGRCSVRLEALATHNDSGTWSFDAGLRELRIAEADAETPRFAIESCGLEGLRLSPSEQLVQLDVGALRGLQTAVRRTEDSSWDLLGFRPLVRTGDVIIVDAGPAPPSDRPAQSVPDGGSETATETETETAKTTLTPWRVEIGRLAIEDTDLAFRDEEIQPAVDFRFNDIGLAVEDLELGGETSTAVGHARVDAYVRQPGLVDSLELTGELSSKPGLLGLDWDLELHGEGIAPVALKPYLDRANIRIVDATGGVQAQLDGSLALVDEVLELESVVTGFALGPVEAPFLAGQEFKLSGVRVSADAIRVGELTLTEPTVRLGRDADGGLLVAGLDIGGEPQEPAIEETDGTDGQSADKSAASAEAADHADPQVVVVVDDGRREDRFAFLDSLDMEFELGHFAVSDARLVWRDEAIEPALESTIRFQASMDGLALRPGAAGADFVLMWTLEGEALSIQIDGNVVLDPDALELSGKLLGEHVDLARATPYLPPSIQTDTKDARLEAELLIQLVAAEAGGRALTLECTQLSFQESASDHPKFSLEKATLHAPRIDGAQGVYELEELSTRGVELHVHHDAESRWHALGLVLDPAAESDATPPDAAAGAEPQTVVRTVSRQPIAPDKDLPRISLGLLDVGIDRLVMTDEQQGEGAEPLVLELRAATSAPQVLMSSDPGGLDPFSVRFSAQASPLIDQLAVELEVAPFSPQPSLNGRLSVRGLNGVGIEKLYPRLTDAVDSQGLPAGEFDASFEAVLDARRRGLTQFEFQRGFGIDLNATDLAFRAEPEGEVLLGLKSLELSAPRINAARREVIVERIELIDPRARLARDADGIHVLGLVIDPVALQHALATEPSDAQPEAAAATPPPAEHAGSKASVAPEAPAEELRIDDLLVSGIDFEFIDTTYDPPLHLPLTQLFVEVSGLNSRALAEKLPIRASVYVEAGDVELGQGYAPAPVFEEAALNGQVSIYPQLEGWLETSMTELQLRALRGPAAASGVTISSGTMDSSTKTRFRGEGVMSLDPKLTFRELSVSEPSDGPIARLLGISVPLESALFALRNSNGEVVIAPPTIRMDSSGISTAEIARVATAAIAKDITLAVARAPLRLTKGVADTAGALTGGIPIVGGVTGGIFGVFGSSDDEELPPIGSIAYLPADVNFIPAEATKLQAAIDRLKDRKKAVLVLTHEFTTADLERATELASPSAEDCRELTVGLRRKKAALYRVRDEVSATARTHLLTGRQAEADAALDRLRAIDSELGRTEIALDHILELLQPGADRRREKRGREAAMEIAEMRLAQVIEALRGAGIKKLESRLEVRRPRLRPVETEEQAGEGGRIQLGIR